MQTFPLQRLLVDALAARAASLFSCSLAYTHACTPHEGAVLCARSRTHLCPLQLNGSLTTSPSLTLIPSPFAPSSMCAGGSFRAQKQEQKVRSCQRYSSLLHAPTALPCLLAVCRTIHNPSRNRHTRHSPPTPRSGLQVYTLCPADTSLRLPTFASIVPRLCRFSDVCGRCATPQPQSKTPNANAVSCPVDGCVSVRGRNGLGCSVQLALATPSLAHRRMHFGHVQPAPGSHVRACGNVYHRELKCAANTAVTCTTAHPPTASTVVLQGGGQVGADHRRCARVGAVP
jgi:hypothetical protein